MVVGDYVSVSEGLAIDNALFASSWVMGRVMVWGCGGLWCSD